MAVGVIHGLAGSAAIALLVLGAVQGTLWSLLYLTVFGVGTVLGMMLLTLLISAPMVKAGNWRLRAQSILVRSTGVASLVVGLFLAYRIGFVDGLFSAHPSWQPE